MAETYGVYDWRQLPLVTAATLAQGLPATSRVAKKTAGYAADEKTILLAIIADRIGHIAWMFSKDGNDELKHPPSLLEKLIGSADPDSGFDSAEDFDAAWAAITGTGGDVNA